MRHGTAISQVDFAHVLSHTAALWPALRDARLFVTGGTGFVGKWLLETFLAANALHGLAARATVLTRDVARFRMEARWIAEADEIELVQGDIRRFAFPEGPFSHLIHAASDMSLDAPVLEIHEVIGAGARRVLDFAVARRIPDVLFVSSGAVYGPQSPALERLDEEFTGAPPLSDPATAYGQGKREAEWLAHAYASAHGLRCRIGRLFTFTGPYLPRAYAAASFVEDLVARRPISVGGDGTGMRTYLYAADMAIWLWTALLRGPPGLVCNIGGEEAISMADLAAVAAGLAKPTLPVRITHGSSPSRSASRYVPSIARARQVLGVAPKVLLEDGLQRMISSQQSAAPREA